MKLVVLGLTLSSSWGNGHATTYRALLSAFAARGHEVLFLEREKPWYAGDRRDLIDPPYARLEFYDSVAALDAWRAEVAAADAVIVGSYTPEGVAVGRWAQAAAQGVVAFYDIDTPVTLAKLAAGDEEYLSAELIPGYDLYLSFTGGPTLDLLERRYDSPAARALYCSVDAERYRPLDLPKRWDLSYLGTYSPDRQPTLERLLLEPARRSPGLRFVVAGPQYPADVAWPANVERIEHLPPADHAAFYSQSRWTLNVTRADMIAAGWSPSVRLFEAAACAAPVISDAWPGLEALFTPAAEIVIASGAEDVLAQLRDVPAGVACGIGEAARRRVAASHTSAHRAGELERLLLSVRGG
ncbi:MAG: glycosyltransferase [Caulobacteraceae bacterium]|nr:glycosyltransferase [Caulobacter sp.]